MGEGEGIHGFGRPVWPRKQTSSKTKLPSGTVRLYKPRRRHVRLNPRRMRKGTTRQKPDSFRFIDLFAGIGGLRIGFESIGGTCVFTSEWNKYSQQTYVANFGPGHPINGDITKIVVEEIPEHDVLYRIPSRRHEPQDNHPPPELAPD